jgi:sugar/nucleoside kinase (ribokinase family)
MLPAVTKPLVVALGRATVALAGLVPRFPDHDAVVELSSVSVQPGGAGAIAISTVAALGCGARLCTKLADDFLSRFVYDALTAAEIDLRLLHDLGGRLSPFSFVASSEDHSHRLGFTTAGDVADIDPDEVDGDALLSGADALLVDGSAPPAQSRLAELARQRDVPVVFAGGTTLREGTGELVALADVLVCSERLGAELAPRGELKDSLVELQRLGPGAVVLTLGAAGSIGLHGDQLVEHPAFPVEVVDPTGAGDVYAGAFVVAMLSQLSFADCMEFACATAALSCRALGPCAGIPDRDEVAAFLRGA